MKKNIYLFLRLMILLVLISSIASITPGTGSAHQLANKGKSINDTTIYLPVVINRAIYKRILFNSERDGKANIYSMKPDGSSLTQLTDNADYYYASRWSHDGTNIAFLSNAEIYTMDAYGDNKTKLTNTSAQNYYPVWSPDDKKIAFISNRDGNWEIYSMNVDSSNQVNLTNNSATDEYPSWSPDGKRIVYDSGSNPYSISIMNSDGGGKTLLVSMPDHSCYQPEWNPVSDLIAFTCHLQGTTSYDEVYTIHADGTGLKLMTQGLNGFFEHWSPDGKQMTFTIYHFVGNNYTIGLDAMNADGTGWVDLGHDNFHNNGDSSWSPDGKMVAFLSYRDGNGEIYRVNSDGTGLIRLTNNPAYDADPLWQP
jgi:TolB protein